MPTTALPKDKVTCVRRELISQISDKLRLPQTEVRAVVNTLLELCMTSLEAGERIELRGFGVFDTRVRAAKIVRNPRTGELLQGSATLATSFKPSVLLTRRLKLKRLLAITDATDV